MGVSGPPFAGVMRAWASKLDRGVARFAAIVREAWLTQTRLEVAQFRRPAPRDTWRANVTGSTVTIGWQDFGRGSGSDAAKRRFARAREHHSRIVARFARRFNLLRGA